MSKLINRIFILLFSFLFFPAAILNAGDWHAPAQLACTDCHTMHNSSAGKPMRYDRQASPGPRLLRHATSLSLCVHCHDGSNPNAPDVITPVTYASDPAGGYFANTGGAESSTAHNLGMPSPEPSPGSKDSFILTCVTCHDPHGNANYRNLRPNPAGSPGSREATVSVKQNVKANGSNPAKVYVLSNLLYKSGMSQWCKSCHLNFHGRSPGEEGLQSPWFRHPQEKQISGSANVDFSGWSGDLSNRVPVQTPNDDTVPSDDDQVFCLTCHKAHGSANKGGTIFADKATLNSTCQQCHNQ